jgi:phosphoribosylglycinamide formyltransferase 1
MRSRIAVLASGGGSNLQAILEYFDQRGDRRHGDVSLVVSDRPTAGVLQRAENRSLATAVVALGENSPGVSLADALAEHAIDLIVLAGYLRLIPAEVVARYHGRIINIHPALLPAFGGKGMYGLRVHRAVLESGASVTGVTAHFVDEVYDHGRIIAQWPVPVFPADDAGTLAARVLRVEHLLYPRVVDAVAAGRTTVINYAILGSQSLVDTKPSFTLLPHEDSRLAENIDIALGC